MATTKRQHLVETIADLVACSERLRDLLRRYERTMLKIGERLEDGTPAVAAGKGLSIPSERRDVTEAIQEFEASRHRLRLALFAVGKDEGASISEIGRALGISRQLASRLAGESQETGTTDT
jgi:hypothetical protein